MSLFESYTTNLNEYSARERFEAGYRKYGYQQLAASSNENYILCGKYEEEEGYNRLYITMNNNGHFPEIYLEKVNSEGTIELVEIGWASYSDNSIEFAQEFVSNLQEAIEFANTIKGQTYNLKGE